MTEAPAPEPFGRIPFLACLLLAWLAASAFSLAVHWQSIGQFDMSDPDDHLRLVQVRDWLAGQSWFDVSQHRFDPRGGDMHWSRIVDLPIAALILLFRPMLGTAGAEAAAITLVPLLLLGGTMVSLGYAVRPLAGRGGALLAALLVPLIPSLLNQMAPTRIDHHGWQIAMAAVCLALIVSSRGAGAVT